MTVLLVKVIMDGGREIGKFFGLFHYLEHRFFSKPLVLNFHHLGPPQPGMSPSIARYYCSTEQLEEVLMGALREGRWVLSLSEIIKRLKSSPNSLYFEKLLAITFDDGYESIYQPVNRLLKSQGHPFTVFVPTAFIGKTNEWDRSEGCSEERILNWEKLGDLNSRGVEIGSHTRSHLNLVGANGGERDREISGSLQEIKRIFPDNGYRREFLFSYPYGAFDDEVRKRTIEAGYFGAVANFGGNIRPGTDPWQIPRFSVEQGSNWESISKLSRSMWVRDLARDLRDWAFG
jgi:peptidoglycan/xylan/chitin deacetylase (PgdA/CDA1 family)